ncbi:hypothetical protein FISHEDRAFT_62840 [Fistulina hepatica ATCC 64428]|uniref:Uncharacterized protein n=1 Tax=Fistulina hepatica ATCC 64428 TaxID=1128425 RepID=A0A0D7A1A3_9AGAR|nr:hypothetical protein FISHEDRAFT_62840 [Fistulina hepatica ATCC 64428]
MSHVGLPILVRNPKVFAIIPLLLTNITRYDIVTSTQRLWARHRFSVDPHSYQRHSTETWIRRAGCAPLVLNLDTQDDLRCEVDRDFLRLFSQIAGHVCILKLLMSANAAVTILKTGGPLYKLRQLTFDEWPRTPHPPAYPFRLDCPQLEHLYIHHNLRSQMFLDIPWTDFSSLTSLCFIQSNFNDPLFTQDVTLPSLTHLSLLYVGPNTAINIFTHAKLPALRHFHWLGVFETWYQYRSVMDTFFTHSGPLLQTLYLTDFIVSEGDLVEILWPFASLTVLMLYIVIDYPTNQLFRMIGDLQSRPAFLPRLEELGISWDSDVAIPIATFDDMMSSFTAACRIRYATGNSALRRVWFYVFSAKGTVMNADQLTVDCPLTAIDLSMNIRNDMYYHLRKTNAPWLPNGESDDGGLPIHYADSEDGELYPFYIPRDRESDDTEDIVVSSGRHLEVEQQEDYDMDVEEEEEEKEGEESSDTEMEDGWQSGHNLTFRSHDAYLRWLR